MSQCVNVKDQIDRQHPRLASRNQRTVAASPVSRSVLGSHPRRSRALRMSSHLRRGAARRAPENTGTRDRPSQTTLARVATSAIGTHRPEPKLNAPLSPYSRCSAAHHVVDVEKVQGARTIVAVAKVEGSCAGKQGERPRD